MTEFLQNALVTNRQTIECDNIKWPVESTAAVIGQPNSIIISEDIEAEIIEGVDPEELQFKEVDTKLLPIDWIFRSQKGTESNFIEFLYMLKNVNNDQVYALEFTGALIEYVWDYYSTQIKYMVFYPFVFMFLVCHIYFAIIVSEAAGSELGGFFSVVEPICGIILLVLTCAFASMEVVQILEDGIWAYLEDVFNYINVASALVNIMICLSFTCYIPIIGADMINVWAAIGIFLMWLNFLYWMRFFETTAHFIRMIVSTLFDILPFIIIQLIFMGAFGFTLLFLNYDRQE